jgi:hypothetical protein
MSYCRWSSDDYRCDLYCYEDASGGWTTHVARSRYVGERPHPDWSGLIGRVCDPARVALFWEQHTALSDWLATAERVPIGLPHAGATFNDPTPQAFRDRLIALRELGYHFPDYVLEKIDQEIAEAQT